jgi:hypothetical protein
MDVLIALPIIVSEPHDNNWKERKKDKKRQRKGHQRLVREKNWCRL